MLTYCFEHRALSTLSRNLSHTTLPWWIQKDTLKQACEYYNIPYIEQKNSPINGYTIQTLIGTDGVHPSLEGYFQLGAWLSGEVGRLIG